MSSRTRDHVFRAQLSSSFGRKIGFSFPSWNFLEMDIPAEPLETEYTEAGGLPAREGLALDRDPTEAAAPAERACASCALAIRVAGV